MYCPQCKAEYRPGFTRCADCDVDLVDQLPVAPEPAAGVSEPLEVVWSSDSQQDCVSMCEWFREREIPYTVNQRRKQIWAGGIKENYDILVPSEFAAQVKADFAKADDDAPSPEDAERYLTLPDDATAPLQPEPRDFRPWFPEDAVVEVFSELSDQDDNKQVPMIEASLRENLIHSRTEDSDGARRIFVIPEDEPRAREIVREVTTGSPPS